MWLHSCSSVSLARLQKDVGPQPRPGQAGGISCHTGTAIPPCPAVPHPCCPWECTELEPSSRCLLLLPRFAAHVKPNMFSKAFQFLMKTSAFTLSLASARRYFGRCCCLASPGIRGGPVFPSALTRQGCCSELAVALRQDPSTSQSLAAHPGASCASPRRSTGPDLASLLPMMFLGCCLGRRHLETPTG